MRRNRGSNLVTRVGVFMAALVALSGGGAWAGSSGQLCIKEKIGGNPPCTANDVRISALVTTGGPITCVPGDPLTVTLIATIESSPARYDIGLWVNETGGSALSDPGGSCYRDYLNPRSANNVGCSQIFPGPYFNGELTTPADTCGDVPAINGSQLCGAVPMSCTGGGGNCIFSTYQFTATFECTDFDNDGTADLGTCTSWDNNTNNTCTNELNTDPGTGSKCNCGRTDIGNIFIDPCVSANCDDGVSCTIDTCDSTSGSAVCSHTPDDSICNDGQFCNGVETCDPVNDCEAGTPPNCSDGQACTTDTCNELTDQCNSVPNNAFCDDGLFCTGTEICDPVNGCLDGLDPNCDDGITCTVDACDEINNTCTNTANNAACNDGQFCNGVETCNPLSGCQAGAPPNCNDGVTCTLDACDEVNDVCTHTANDAVCNDGLFCNGTETCNPLSGCQVGVSPNCNDGVTCTLDACDEANDICTHTPSNATCSDGQFCTGVELCDPVNDCQPGSDPCPGAFCNEASDVCSGCLDDADCDNGVFCDGVEICGPGSICQPGTPPNCNDGVTCTLDACDEANDTCTHTPSDAFCSDGQFCTGIETCHPTNDCQAGTPPDCDDAVACTDDVCNESIDACVSSANDANCSDGQFCNGAEICNPLSGCQAGSPPNCNDGVGCTADACDELNDACANVPNDSVCDDAQFCNGEEVCSPIDDCQAGSPPNCADAQACTVDACNEVDDQCESTPADASCSDGLYCNGTETCDALNGCQAGAPPDCDDLVACTVDSCDEANDTCVSSPDNALCDDGLYCTGLETCNPFAGCTDPPDVNCDDGFVCSVDSCDEVNDVCANFLGGCFCGDAEVTGTEECEPPGTALGTEICNNLIDDDDDGFIDCNDSTDCPAFCEHDSNIPCTRHKDCRLLLPGIPPKTSCIGASSGCDDNCLAVLACNAAGPDPSIIRFGTNGGLDYFTMHASFVPQTEMSPVDEGFGFVLSNANGVIYQAQLHPGDLVQKGSSRFSYKDLAAKYGESTRDGIYQVRIKRRVKYGRLDYAFWVRIYGDFSAATDPVMLTQVTIGNDGTMVLDEWTQTPQGWLLDQDDF